MYVVKKDGTKEEFDISKVINAVKKSANRAMSDFNPKQIKFIKEKVTKEAQDMSYYNKVTIEDMHHIVECTLDEVDPAIAKSYRDYRNYKQEFAQIMNEVYEQNQRIMYRGDHENSNADSALVSTKRALSYNVLNEKLYEKFHLTEEERQASKDGYIYIHDKSARRDTMNCCLFNFGKVMKDGFSMGNMFYTEPKTLDVAFDVLGDITLSAAGQQYGGFTLPQIDEVLNYYAEKSYKKYKNDYVKIKLDGSGLKLFYKLFSKFFDYRSDKYAMKKIEDDIRQGYQGLEYKFNTVASCRGDYPFITITLGLGKDKFSKLISKTIFRTHAEGQGKPGFKQTTVFPKLVFLYDKFIHGKGKECRDVYKEALKCSIKSMYPDFLSLTSGNTYLSNIYLKYGKVISPMGCRAFLSPWFEKGGQNPADDNDVPVYIGRFNIGAISLNLPMIYQKSVVEGTEFYDELNYYMDLIRNIHLRTYEYIGNMKASMNPLAFCEGGFYGGNLDLQDKIAPLLKSATASFGITALNELQQIYNQKSLVEDGEFALQTMKYISDRIEMYKKEDGKLYAIYGTPAESLCSKQVKQFRNKYGIIKNVSDREYVSNSFHCHVTEDITPIQKQDLEGRFWDIMKGGQITYTRQLCDYNFMAISSVIDRGMDKGFYNGINFNLSFCEDCGHNWKANDPSDSCPKCGSNNTVCQSRMNGYLSTVKGNHGDGSSRLQRGKMIEIHDRKSM